MAGKGIVYLNGNYCPASEAKISIFDRSVLFADAVYEVIPVYQGRLFCLESHLKRLKYNLNNIKIDPPKLDWESIFMELIKQNGGDDLQIYLQITRGNQGFRSHDIPQNILPTVIAYTLHNSYPSLAEKERGMCAKLVDDIRWLRCDIKTTSLIANILLNDAAISSGYNTAILIRNGYLTEGSASNIFIVDSQERICTPPPSHLCMPGVTRQVTIELLKDLSWPLYEEEISVQAIFTAKEVWLTSTTKEIFPITQVNDIAIGKGSAGEYWRRINERYQQQLFRSNV